MLSRYKEFATSLRKMEPCVPADPDAVPLSTFLRNGLGSTAVPQ